MLLALLVLSGGALTGADTKLKGTLPANWGKLGLTDDQKQKVYKVQADYKDKIADLEKQLKELKDTEKTDMEKVLTDEQKKRLRELLGSKAPAEEKKEEK
jgi:Spy/CpxP family protein refolding chaperone